MSRLAVENVEKEFETRGDPLKILRGIDLTLNAGENVAILGPSGSGKSTLLHIIGTLDRPTSGKVVLDGTDPFSLSEKDLAEFRNKHIGFIFQEHHLLPQLSVLENVLVPGIASGSATKNDIQRAKDLIEQVGLSDRSQHRPSELSGGERQRVAVARALLRKPKLVLADEPTGSLDQSNASTIGKLLLDLNASEETILITVTHSTGLAELFQSSFVIDNGRLTELSKSK